MLREQKSKFIIVTLLMAVVGVTETIIITLIVPLLSLVVKGEPIAGGFLGQASQYIENILIFFRMELTLGLVLGLIVAIFMIQGLMRILQMRLQMKMLTDYEASLIHKLFDGFLATSWTFFLRRCFGKALGSV